MSSARALVICAAALAAIGLAPLAVGLLGALVLYEVCVLPYRWLAQKLPPRVAALLMVLAVVVLVAAPASWLIHHLVARMPAVRAALANPNVPGVSDAQWEEYVTRGRDVVSAWLPRGVFSILGSAAWALVNWSIALLGLYYLFGSASTLWPRFAHVLPVALTSAETLRIRFRDTTQAMVAGTLLSATVQGAAIGTGFWLAGLPEAPFWGAVAAVATLVPVVGNSTVWLPTLLVMLLERRYESALAIGIFGGMMPPVIDRVVRAGVSRRMSQVHPMVTVVGALAGIRVAGVAGLVLGPVALDMLFALFDVYSREYMASSTGTRA